MTNAAGSWGAHGFDKLEVFERALDLLEWGDRISDALCRRRESLNRQLQRAIDSVLANIGEAATEFSAGDKIRLFRYAVRSNGESSSLIHGAERIRALTPSLIEEGKQISLGLRIKLLQLIGALGGKVRGPGRATRKRSQDSPTAPLSRPRRRPTPPDPP